MDIKTFRPKARLIATIGSEIIKDKYAAIIELVKNAYDADANKVIIDFEICQQNLRIIIEDQLVHRQRGQQGRILRRSLSLL